MTVVADDVGENGNGEVTVDVSQHRGAHRTRLAPVRGHRQPLLFFRQGRAPGGPWRTPARHQPRIARQAHQISVGDKDMRFELHHSVTIAPTGTPPR